MTKYNEILDHNEAKEKINYINSVWANWSEARSQTLSRITNYLFVLNTGALIASLTYVSAKGTNDCIYFSIYLFASGILFSVIHAALDYYLIEKYFKDYKKDVDQFFNSKLDWEALIEQNNKRSSFDWLLHLLGWAGAIVFFVGLYNGVQQL